MRPAPLTTWSPELGKLRLVDRQELAQDHLAPPILSSFSAPLWYPFRDLTSAAGCTCCVASWASAGEVLPGCDSSRLYHLAKTEHHREISIGLIRVSARIWSLTCTCPVSADRTCRSLPDQRR